MPRKSKKNAHGAGTIRIRSNGRWEARYTTGFDTLTGKQIQKSIYGRTQKEVREKLTQITSELDDGTYVPPNAETVGEWLDTWLKVYALHSVRPYTYDSYERSCNLHLKPALGKIRLSSLSAPQIQRLYNRLLIDKGLSPKTVQIRAGLSRDAVHRPAAGRSPRPDMGLHRL